MGEVINQFILILIAIFSPFLFFIWLSKLLSAPLKRMEQIKQFLDITEFGIKNGITPEDSIIEATKYVDKTKKNVISDLMTSPHNAIFDILTSQKRFLSKQVLQMLKVGIKSGNIINAFPACRDYASYQYSRSKAFLNTILFMVFPHYIMIHGIIIFILPKYQRIHSDLLKGEQLPYFTELFIYGSDFIYFLGLILLCTFIFLIFLYQYGYKIYNFLPLKIVASFAFYYLTPWRKIRLKIDFMKSLALLLDNNVNEDEAIILSANATDNYIFQMKAKKSVNLLKSGTSLTKVLTKVFDSTGELEWRIKNSILLDDIKLIQSIKKWCSFLDIKAYQLEQGATQLFTTGLLFLTSFIIAMFLIAMCLPLRAVIEAHLLW